MNILPKKRWHVRTKENIARVRRDEAQAAEEEKKRIERAKLAEQESRTLFLRQRAREKYSSNSVEDEPPQPSADASATGSKKEVDIYTREGNINFFKDIEAGKKTEAVNKEHEAEKKAEQEKYEKKIGLLTYLGQSSLEATGPNAWCDEVRTISRKGGVELEEVGLKSKNAQDPLNDIIKYTGLKPPPKLLVKKSELFPPVNKDTSFLPGHKTEAELHETKSDKRYKVMHKKTKKERKKKKKLKHKKKRKHKHSKDSDRKAKKRKREDLDSESSEEEQRNRKHRKLSKDGHIKESVTDDSSEEDSEEEREQEEKRKRLEILRAERLKREAEERKRTEKLLKGEKSDSKDKEPKPAFKQQYNSQFNPQLARQNQEPKQLQAGVKYWLQ